VTIIPEYQSNMFEVDSFDVGHGATDTATAVTDDQGRGSGDGGEPAVTQAPPSTLAEALVFVEQHNLLTEKPLAEARSAVKLLEKVIGRNADQIPAAPQDLTPLIQSAFPARYGIRAKRWSNAVSAIRGLLRACGLHAPLVRRQSPADPAWLALLLTIPGKNERLRILAFACWCSDRGIRPDDVTEQTLADYAEFRRTMTIRTHLTQLISSIRIFWNRGVRAQVPGWPRRLLSAPRRPHVEALPLNSFPVSFQNELTEYLTKHTAPDAFDPDRNLWRPATVNEVRRCLIRAASLAARRVGGPENIRSLANIVTIEAVEFVLRHLYDRAGGVWGGYAGNFATYLLMLARDHVRVDTTALARITELREIVVKRRREHRKPGLSERVAERIMPFDDPKLLRRFFKLPQVLYEQAHKMLHKENRPVRAAQMHEQGLMLEILHNDPMRRFNLATLHFDDFKRDERGQIVRLWVSAERTKNGIAIDTPVSSELSRHLMRHWTVYRPKLRGSDSPWLFPSPQGKPRAVGNVTKTLGRIVTRSLGVTFTPHMVRHIIATSIYRTNPNSGVVVQRILRHASIKTTERAYGMMSNAGSSAAWQEDLHRYRNATARRKNRTPVRRRKGVEGTVIPFKRPT
jgi:integrase